MFRPRRVSIVAALVAASLVAAACGDDDDSSSGSATTAGSAAGGVTTAAATTVRDDSDPNGVLKMAISPTTTGAAIVLDPVRSRSVDDYIQTSLIYGTLIQFKSDGTYEPGLAESFQIVDPQTVKVVLRSGLTFTDNTPLDAEAVKFTIDRNVAAKNANHAPVINEVASVTVNDPKTVTIALKTKVAGSFLEALAGREAMPVSPTAARKGDTELTDRPVGAGPFKVERIDKDQLIALRKNPAYWDAKTWKLGGIDLVVTAAGAAVVNALSSGAVGLARLTADQAAGFQGRSGFTSRSDASDSNFSYIAICKNKPPFDKVEFRQAVAYAIDREAINRNINSGLGEPMYMFWPKSSKFFTSALDNTYKLDLAKAKQLLTQAGYPNGVDLQLAVSGQPTRLHETVQSQLTTAGIRTSLVPVADIITEFYTNVKTPGAISAWIRPGLQKVTRAFGPNSVANVCQYSSTELNSLTDQLAQIAPDDPKAKGLWDQVNKFVMDNVLWIFINWDPVIHVWDSKLGGKFEVNVPLRMPDFKQLYIKK